MKISLYTAVKNGIANDLHVEAMLRHHLPLADEVIVNEGYSSDETLARVTTIDSKIKVFRSRWEVPKSLQWSVAFKEAARQKCTGDWCILLDCDEFIPEWEFDQLRGELSRTSELMLPVTLVNFYGSWRVYHTRPERVNWPARKMIIHRNLPEFEIWGDGSNVRLRGTRLEWGCEAPKYAVHHFGMVRDPAILRYKWWVQGRAVKGLSTRLRPPKALFRLFPHDWLDPQFLPDLAIYNGPAIQAVRENPAEFERDGMTLLRALQQPAASPG